jgi:hypothetical protein
MAPKKPAHRFGGAAGFFCLFETLSTAKKMSNSGVKTYGIRHLAYRKKSGKP